MANTYIKKNGEEILTGIGASFREIRSLYTLKIKQPVNQILIDTKTGTSVDLIIEWIADEDCFVSSRCNTPVANSQSSIVISINNIICEQKNLEHPNSNYEIISSLVQLNKGDRYKFQAWNIENHSSSSYKYPSEWVPIEGNDLADYTVSDLIDKVDNLNTQLNQINQTAFNAAHPVGEIYVQYPFQLSPNDLYNVNGVVSNWIDISSTYAGSFFRAEGGGSIGFGSQQACGLPNITGMFGVARSAGFRDDADVGGAFFLDTSETLNWIPSFSQENRGKYIRFDANRSHPTIYGNSGEVTPKNYAVRIWKRNI